MAVRTVVANGSTLEFGSFTFEVVTIDADESPKEIERQHLLSVSQEVEGGVLNPTVEATVLGYTGDNVIPLFTKAALTVTPAGGSSDNYGVERFIFIKRKFSGITKDGEMGTTLTFRPTNPTDA